MKFCVTVAATGCVFVEAESESEAMDIVNNQKEDAICWSGDWVATDACEDDSALPCMYIKKECE